MDSEAERSPPSSASPEDLDGGSGTHPRTDGRSCQAKSRTYALPNEAGREPTSTGGTPATETGEPKGGSRRVGGELRYSEWFTSHPEWRTDLRQSSLLDPYLALLRILELRNEGRYVGANPTNMVMPFHLKGPTGAKESYSAQQVSPLQGREELEDEKARVILSRMAEPTQKTYVRQPAQAVGALLPKAQSRPDPSRKRAKPCKRRGAPPGLCGAQCHQRPTVGIHNQSTPRCDPGPTC